MLPRMLGIFRPCYHSLYLDQIGDFFSQKENKNISKEFKTLWKTDHFILKSTFASYEQMLNFFVIFSYQIS